MKLFTIALLSLCIHTTAFGFSKGPCDRVDRFERDYTDSECQLCQDKLMTIAKKASIEIPGQAIMIHLSEQQLTSPGVTQLASEYQKLCVDVQGAPELTFSTTKDSQTLAGN